MVEFAAHFTIHSIEIGYTFYLESVVLESRSACQSECSLHCFHVDRISNLFAIHRMSSHTLLADSA